MEKQNNWRSKLDGITRKHLELQLREAYKYNKAYNLSKNSSNAQIWVAVANLSRQIFEMNLRMNVLERALKDTIDKLNAKTISTKKSVSNKKRKK